MNKLIFVSLAATGLILTPAGLAGEGCPYSAAKKLPSARADGASCAASAKTVQVAQTDAAVPCTKKATQVASADGVACAMKANSRKVALADSAACTASSKAIQVAQKSDCESGCESKAQKIVLARAEAKASGGCCRADAVPAVAEAADEGPVVVASQE